MNTIMNEKSSLVNIYYQIFLEKTCLRAQRPAGKGNIYNTVAGKSDLPVLCPAHAEDKSADLLQAGDHQQHGDELSLSEGLRKLQALKDTDQNADDQKTVMGNRGDTGRAEDEGT